MAVTISTSSRVGMMLNTARRSTASMPLRAALDRPRQAAGLAVQVEAQREPVQVLEGLQRQPCGWCAAAPRRTPRRAARRSRRRRPAAARRRTISAERDHQSDVASSAPARRPRGCRRSGYRRWRPWPHQQHHGDQQAHPRGRFAGGPEIGKQGADRLQAGRCRRAGRGAWNRRRLRHGPYVAVADRWKGERVGKQCG